MAKMNILYISLEGNTRSFVKRLTAFAKQQNMINQANPEINAKEIGPQDAPASESKPFFVFVPTYLTGGNGIDSGYTEIMTRHWVSTLRTVITLVTASAWLVAAIRISTSNTA